MSARNLTALGCSMGLGIITGWFSCTPTGVYIFNPIFQEQQKANEFWRSPGYVLYATVPALEPLVNLK
ncbi:hypothetical protein diail_9781 [Diaporthe ilicicola]|nr:hypothetical protein diail_9781 [Diaporthe ilicicola]